ncbi:MAG: hypothetical protein OHK0012_21690 [Synechococcales cyanobacterium]
MKPYVFLKLLQKAHLGLLVPLLALPAAADMASSPTSGTQVASLTIEVVDLVPTQVRPRRIIVEGVDDQDDFDQENTRPENEDFDLEARERDDDDDDDDDDYDTEGQRRN